ncbi:hypothetical protein ACFL5F_05985 [Planctomycetota bacterium]
MTLRLAGVMIPAVAVGDQVGILIRFKPFLLLEPFYFVVSVRVLSVGCADAEHCRECYRNAGLVVAGHCITLGILPCPRNKLPEYPDVCRENLQPGG